MTDPRPFGTTRATQFGFSKIFVHDLDAIAAFYEEVFGLIPFNRHQDVMLGRAIDEITYQSTYQGGPALTLITYLDSAAPLVGEAVQGFVTTDLEALLGRAEAAGGRVPEPIRAIPDFGIRVAFVLDPEGHVTEVVQMDAA
ncbi:glyoxalase/bleomycin resistance/dioxygenase family protein [Azospirillum sp. 412522]|nr:VOC family protein [Azospirillum sp. 412522]MBY6262119.1 glyoxalase/bleomycin resistance/dioxygenase family protein [Azospirillum sp. 412522]